MTKITVEFEKDALEEYTNKLSDVLCWLAGYEAGGGEYKYDTDTLKELNAGLKKHLYARTTDTFKDQISQEATGI